MFSTRYFYLDRAVRLTSSAEEVAVGAAKDLTSSLELLHADLKYLVKNSEGYNLSPYPAVWDSVTVSEKTQTGHIPLEFPQLVLRGARDVLQDVCQLPLPEIHTVLKDGLSPLVFLFTSLSWPG